MQKIVTFLMFPERCLEAVEFYTSVFKNSKIISRMPGPDGSPGGAVFEIEGQRFNAYEGGPHFSFSQAISLFVNAETQEEIDELYEKLSEGGEEQQCGWLTDKFGVSWQICPPILLELLNGSDREKAKRAFDAMLKMHKIDIQAIKDAAAD